MFLIVGDDYGVGDFGMYVLNLLRLEKGFCLWGFEVLYKYSLINVILFLFNIVLFE